jgi:hypothetical protein
VPGEIEGMTGEIESEGNVGSRDPFGGCVSEASGFKDKIDEPLLGKSEAVVGGVASNLNAQELFESLSTSTSRSMKSFIPCQSPPTLISLTALQLSPS